VARSSRFSWSPKLAGILNRSRGVEASGDPTLDGQGGLVEFREISKRFWKGDDPVDALDQVSIRAEPGEFLGLVGPSGCGKSTLLNLAAGLIRPSRGEVFYNGEPVTGPNTKVGYLTQKDNLIPWRTVVSNVALPLEIRNMSRTERSRRVRSVLDLVGLTGFEKHYPAELSGGMRKRVALAATLAYSPGTLLMDEPFGALDAQLKLVLYEELLAIWQESRKTIIFVTHDLAEAVQLCDRVIVMSPRPGRIKAMREIRIPRPRDLAGMRFDARFNEEFESLWAALSEDMFEGDEVKMSRSPSNPGVRDSGKGE
jgi:NitT/TauT family transport system ATP-binding protein